MKLDDATVKMLQTHWEDGWNSRDLDVIMAPFAPDIVFSSPGISMMTGDPSQSTIEGSDALRAYIEGALARTSDVRYALNATYVGTDSIVMTYTCTVPNHGDTPGSDLMRVDERGQVVEWRCHY